MARYSPTTVPTSPELSQTQRWLREELDGVHNATDDIYLLAQRCLELFTTAGYGGIGQEGDAALSNIGSAWQTVPFNVILIPEPRGVVYDLDGEALAFGEPGVWRMNVKVSLTFSDSNGGRRLQLSLWDVTTDAAAGPTFNFAIGRNTDGANLNFNLLFDVGEGGTDRYFELRIRSEDDSFSSVVSIGSVWDANYVSEYRGDFFDDGGTMRADRIARIGELQ